jgi:hypothetical protein
MNPASAPEEYNGEAESPDGGTDGDKDRERVRVLEWLTGTWVTFGQIAQHLFESREGGTQTLLSSKNTQLYVKRKLSHRSGQVTSTPPLLQGTAQSVQVYKLKHWHVLVMRSQMPL